MNGSTAMQSNDKYENQVQIPHDYFYKMSMKDYNNPHEAVIREFFQNSVDAGCKTFIMFFDDERQEMTLIDDGCGMDTDIIRNRLLVMGGTHKSNPEAIGDFGHAKILIYFSWQQYEILTNRLRVVGKSNLYSITGVPAQDSISGTCSKIKVESAEDYQKIKASADQYFSYCSTQVRVFTVSMDKEGSVEINELDQLLKPKMPIEFKKTDAFQVYIGQELESDYYGNRYLYVRSRGVLMFKRFCSTLKRPVVVETKLRASEIFVQNRDAFKREYQDHFSDLLNKLNNDVLSALSSDFQQFIAEVRKPKRDKPHKDRGEIELFPDFYTLGKTKKAGERYFMKKRAKRMKLFVQELVQLLRKRSGIDTEIHTGFVFECSVEGLATHNYGGSHILYVNPLQVESYTRNKHQMAYKLWDMVIHEFAHIWSVVEDGNEYHNESFVMRMHKARDLVWDFREVYTMFKNCWNQVK